MSSKNSKISEHNEYDMLGSETSKQHETILENNSENDDSEVSSSDEEYESSDDSEDESSDDEYDSADTDYYLQDTDNPSFRDKTVASIRAIDRELEGLQYKKAFKQELLGAISSDSKEHPSVLDLLNEVEDHDHHGLLSDVISQYLTVETECHDQYTFSEWLQEVGEVVEVEKNTHKLHKNLLKKLRELSKLIDSVQNLTSEWCENIKNDLEINVLLSTDFVKIRED